MRWPQNAVLIPAIVAVAATGPTSMAIAWTAQVHEYHILEINRTGGFVNDNHVRVMSRSGFGPWQAQTITPGTMPYSVTAGWAWAPPAVVMGNSLVINFTGPTVGPLSTAWKNFRITVPGSNPPWESAAFFQWTLNGNPVGQEVAVGFCVSSPAGIDNPSVRPDGTPNTTNMIIRNIQFAQSPQAIPNTQLTLDDPTTISLFNASQDQVRPGPFIATPGTCLDITPDIHPSISAPAPGGQTVLVKGITESPTGDQYSFVVQFINPAPTSSGSIPVAPLPVLIGLTILLIGMGAVSAERRRRRALQPLQ